MRPSEASALGFFGGLWAMATLGWMAIEWLVAEVGALLEVYGITLLAAVVAVGILMVFRLIIGSWHLRAWRLLYDAP